MTHMLMRHAPFQTPEIYSCLRLDAFACGSKVLYFHLVGSFSRKARKATHQEI